MKSPFAVCCHPYLCAVLLEAVTSDEALGHNLSRELGSNPSSRRKPVCTAPRVTRALLTAMRFRKTKPRSKP